MSRAAYDVAIVGAGIVGAACANECARHGMRVVLIDQDSAGGGATNAAMGHIVVMDDSEAQFSLTRYSQQLWQELKPQLPDDVEYEQCGTIWVAADEDEMQAVRRKHAYYSRDGVPVEVLDSESLRRLEPNLRNGLAGGLLVPEDGVLYPPCAARFLMERAQASGTTISLGVQVSRMGNGCVRLSDGGEFSAPVIVNAAGAASPMLTPGIEVKKRKGHLVITDRYPGLVRHQLVGSGWNVGDGEFAFGAGDGIVGIVDDIDPPFHPAMCVAIDADLARPRQVDGDSLVLVRQGQVEHGALTVIPVRVVQHRIAIDDVQAAHAYHLNVGFEFAFVVVDFRLLGVKPLLLEPVSTDGVEERYVSTF